MNLHNTFIILALLSLIAPKIALWFLKIAGIILVISMVLYAIDYVINH